MEYALLVGLIGLAVVGAVMLFGENLGELFDGAADALEDATPTTTS